MSALPLDASAFSGDFGAYETAPWSSSSGSGFPPVPGAAPSAQGPSSGTVPMLSMSARASPPPDVASAVDASRSWATPPLAAYGDPVAAPQAAQLDIPTENGNSLGLAFILFGLGAYLGTKYVGGLYGGVAGAIYGGAASNLLRSARFVTRGTPATDREALVSATYGVIGVGFGSYILWKTKRPAREKYA
jgi:hypothetical protein